MKKLHPLLTEGANQHYVNKEGKMAIEEMEDSMTVSQMIGFCKGSIMKYSLREKGQNGSDCEKIAKYIDYEVMLEGCPVDARWRKVFEYYLDYKLEWRYS